MNGFVEYCHDYCEVLLHEYLWTFGFLHSDGVT